MNKVALFAGLALLGFSLYLALPVACNELSPPCVNTEFNYTVLPYSLAMLGFLIVLLTIGVKSISLIIFGKA